MLSGTGSISDKLSPHIACQFFTGRFPLTWVRPWSRFLLGAAESAVPGSRRDGRTSRPDVSLPLRSADGDQTTGQPAVGLQETECWEELRWKRAPLRRLDSLSNSKKRRKTKRKKREKYVPCSQAVTWKPCPVMMSIWDRLGFIKVSPRDLMATD